MDLETNKQTIYGGKQVPMTSKHHETVDQHLCHRDDIICLKISQDRKKVVSGQIGKSPSVHVWDAQTC